jgi:predicted HicB family RNase H-like nuclease
MQTISQNDNGNRGSDVMVSVSIRIPKSVDRAVEIAAAHKDCSKQQLVVEALRAYLMTGAAA